MVSLATRVHVDTLNTVEPLNNRHLGTGGVHYMEGTGVTCIFNELARHVVSLLVML